MSTNPLKMQEKEPVSTLWLAYFMASIGVLGSVTVYLTSLPLFLLSRVWEGFYLPATRCMKFAVGALLASQPWLDDHAEISLPQTKDGRTVPCLTVSNHRSHLDMFLLLAHVPGVHTLAKKSLFYNPFLALPLWAMGSIAVPNQDALAYVKGMELAEADLRRGRSFHLFPERTRCPEGYLGIQPFSLLPFSLARRAGVPIVPIVLAGTDEAWPKNSLGLRWRKRVTLVSLKPVDPNNYPSAEALCEAVGTLMTAKWHELSLLNRNVATHELTAVPTHV